jgi:hypothetical protein
MAVAKFYIKSVDTSNINLDEIKKDLSYFKTKEYKDSDLSSSGQDLLRLFMRYCEKTSFHYHTQFATFSCNQTFYRTRAVEKKDLKKTIENEEFLSPPNHLVGWGRVNKRGESVLYASVDPETAIKENHEITDYFIVVHIQLIKPVKLTSLNKLFTSNNNVILPKNNLDVFYELDNFLYNLLLNKTNSNSNYILTNSILEKFYSHENTGGYYYPSVANPSSFNIALKKDLEASHLKVTKVELFRKKRNNIVLKKTIKY